MKRLKELLELSANGIASNKPERSLSADLFIFPRLVARYDLLANTDERNAHNAGRVDTTSL